MTIARSGKLVLPSVVLVCCLGGCGGKPVASLDDSRPDPNGVPRPVIGSRNAIEKVKDADSAKPPRGR